MSRGPVSPSRKMVFERHLPQQKSGVTAGRDRNVFRFKMFLIMAFIVTVPFAAIGVKDLYDYLNPPDTIPTQYYPPDE